MLKPGPGVVPGFYTGFVTGLQITYSVKREHFGTHLFARCSIADYLDDNPA